MSDALLTRIAVALEAIAAGSGLAPSPAAAEPAPKKGKKAAGESAAGSTLAAGTGSTASAPTAAQAQPAPAASGVASTGSPKPTPAPTPQTGADLMSQAANAVIDLANNYSRDSAVEAMAKFGAKKVSQITDPANLVVLIKDVAERIEAEKAKKANESLV